MSVAPAMPSDRSVALRRAGRHALAAVVERALRAVPEGGAVLVAASGGADSTALSLLAVSVAARGRWRVSLGTVDHDLREGSAADADFVEGLGAWLDVPVLRERVQVSSGRQVAAAARRERYRALQSMAGVVGAEAVLMAHHAEDQFETMLMRLARGSGARAAGGMPASRRIAPGVRLLRPVLERSRNELRGLLQACGVPWREDPGNAGADRTRGRLRHRVVAELEAMAPGAAVRASRVGRRIRAAAALLARSARDLVPGTGPWPRSALRKAPREVLAQAIRQLATDACEAEVERCVRAIRAKDTRPRRCRLGQRTLEVAVRGIRFLPRA
jgi:tRNA(Ile)-lysidine synthase